MRRTLRVLVGALVISLALGGVGPVPVRAQPLPPGIREAVSFFSFISAINRRNRVYSEARRTQAEVDAYYDEMRRRLAANLVKGELTTAPGQKPVHSFIRLTQALAAEHAAATAQIEREKKDARHQFRRDAADNVGSLIAQSPGGTRLVGDIKKDLDNLRRALELARDAADGATLDAALQALSEQVTSSEHLGELTAQLGGLLAQELDRELGGILSRLSEMATRQSQNMGEVLSLLNGLDRRLDELSGSGTRVPISIAGDGSPLSDIRLVKDADAALNVALDALIRHGMLIGAIGDLTDDEYKSMRDRIRDMLLISRLADLDHAVQLATTVRCEHVDRDRYLAVASELGQTPEEPREGSKVRYLVCFDNKTGEAVFGALIGPAKADTTTTATEGDDGDSSGPPDGVQDAYAPITRHLEVGGAASESDEQYLTSHLQIWLEPEGEGEMSAVATPHLSGGAFDISYDFEAMTVSGGFHLTYERDPSETTLCEGSPESFTGTASGSFADLPIVEAVTTEQPPSDWGLPSEDWWPMEEGDWFIGGSFPVELEMNGVVVPSCVTLDGATTYNEVPINEAATVTAWINSSIGVWRNQGPDHTTIGFLKFFATTNEPWEPKPQWNFSIDWSQTLDRPVPDPLG